MPPASFLCTWEGCSRSFERQALLNRHEKSHAGQGRHQCPDCGKSYARSDVLSRHRVTQHAATPPIMGRPRKVPCQSCITAHAVCSGPAPTSCRSCMEQGLDCVFAGGSRSRPEPSGAQKPDSPYSFTDPTLIEPQGLMEGALGNYQPTYVPDQHQAADLQLPPQTPSTDLFLLAATASDTDDWLRSLGLDMSIPETMDWGLGETDANLFDVFNTHAPNSPNIFQPSAPGAGPSLLHTPSSAHHTSPEDLHGVPAEIPDGQPFDSPWPHIDKPRDPDISIALPNTQFAASNASTFAEMLSQAARETMINIITQSHQAVWPEIDTVNFPSAQTLTVCLNLYHRHFHDSVPVLEKDSFSLETSAPLLVMAMAAIGAMYSRDGLQRLGVALNELVRRAVLYVRENDRRFMFETNIIQALFLQTSFAFYCGSQKAFQQAETSRSVLVQACKRMHLLRPGLSACEALRARSTTPDPNQLRAAEKEDRRQARLGWCIYLLDCQMACLLNLPAQLSLNEVVAPFPTSSYLQGPSATTANLPMFSNVLDAVLTRGIASPPADEFGAAVLSYTLYRMCMDAAAVQSVHDAPNSRKHPVLEFPAHIVQHPQHLLDRLRVLSLSTHLHPTPSLVSCAAIANHSHLQFTRLGLIELVKTAAGKGGTALSRSRAKEKLVAWTTADVCGARRVAAHAGMLSCLLTRYTFDTPAEVLWTFDCALCLWAITLFSPKPVASGPRVITITWSTGAEVDAWISSGGGAQVQGLGDLASLDHKRVLQIFIDRLDQLSWGLAQQYRQVLERLLDRESGCKP